MLALDLPGVYSSFAGDLNKTTWLGPSSVSSWVLWDWLKCVFWDCFLQRRKFHTLSMLTGTEGLLGCWKVLLCRISWGEGMLGLVGVEWMSRSRSSMVFLESWVVLSMVFSILTWHSMNPLDLEKWGKRLCGLYDCTARTVQLHQRQRVGHCQIRADKAVCTARWALAGMHIKGWADLVDTLYKKGYLLNRMHTSRYSLSLWVG